MYRMQLKTDLLNGDAIKINTTLRHGYNFTGGLPGRMAIKNTEEAV